MPWINKPQKKQAPSSAKTETEMRKLRQVAYQNTAWRKMRDCYIKEHPLCDECLKNGKITPAEDVHHIRSPFKKGEINWALLLDEDNLMSLCKTCHAEIHNKQLGHTNPEEVLKQLDDLFNDNKPDSDFE